MQYNDLESCGKIISFRIEVTLINFLSHHGKNFDKGLEFPMKENMDNVQISNPQRLITEKFGKQTLAAESIAPQVLQRVEHRDV